MSNVKRMDDAEVEQLIEQRLAEERAWVKRRERCDCGVRTRPIRMYFRNWLCLCGRWIA